MKVIPNSKFYSEYHGKHPKDQLYFNPDNTVTLFEEPDKDVRDWVYENGVKLKEERKIVNAEAVESIRAFLKKELEKQAEEKDAEEEKAKQAAEDTQKDLQDAVSAAVEEALSSRATEEAAPKESCCEAAYSKEDIDEVRAILDEPDNVNMKVLTKAFVTLLDKLQQD